MFTSPRSWLPLLSRCFLPAATLGFLLASALAGQSVPPALESPPARPPQFGTHGEKLPGMPKFHDPAPYDIDEHTGFTQIFDGKTLTGWDADTSIWRVEDGLMIGETIEGKPKAITTSSIGATRRATSISSCR